MKIIVLMENSVGESNLPAEHGLSFYVETAAHCLLMDTGASDLTWENARALGVDLSKIDTVVLSHGHYDHTGGLMGLSKLNGSAEIYLRQSAFGAFYHVPRYIGMDPAAANLRHLHPLTEPGMTVLDGELSLFSGITGRKLWPQGNRLLTRKTGDRLEQDSFEHEQCLVIRENGCLTLISGCAHNGILNILDRFHELYGVFPDRVLSGFHMMKADAYTDEEIEDIRRTAFALKEIPAVFYTGHCTGLPAYQLMAPILGRQLIALHCGDTIL